MLPRAPGRFLYDFAVYDSHGRLFALVEAKRRFGTTSSWAREWHSTAADRSGQSVDANIVLVAPDRVYVWRHGADNSAAPDLVLDAEPWLAPYFARLKIPVHEVDPRVFEQIVGLWLRDVAEEKPTNDSPAGTANALLAGLRGGEIVEQAAA